MKDRAGGAAIGEGCQERECMEAVSGYDRYLVRVKPTLAFVASRCRDYVDNDNVVC